MTSSSFLPSLLGSCGGISGFPKDHMSPCDHLSKVIGLMLVASLDDHGPEPLPLAVTEPAPPPCFLS